VCYNHLTQLYGVIMDEMPLDELNKLLDEAVMIWEIIFYNWARDADVSTF